MSIGEIIEEKIIHELDVWLSMSEEGGKSSPLSENKKWKQGFRAGIARAKKIVNEILGEPDNA